MDCRFLSGGGAVADRGLPESHRRSEDAGDDTRWTAVATAPDQLTAEMWQQVMWQEMIPAMLDPHDAVSFMGVASTPVRLIVPAELASRAREVLADIQDAADYWEPDAAGETDDIRKGR